MLTSLAGICGSPYLVIFSIYPPSRFNFLNELPEDDIVTVSLKIGRYSMTIEDLSEDKILKSCA